MLDGGFCLHRKWYGLLEGFFSFRGSLVALKVVQIGGWWLSFAPKVVRTSGRCFSFRGSRVALKVVQVAGWWLLLAESGTDFWKVFFLFVVPVWH